MTTPMRFRQRRKNLESTVEVVNDGGDQQPEESFQEKEHKAGDAETLDPSFGRTFFL